MSGKCRAYVRSEIWIDAMSSPSIVRKKKAMQGFKQPELGNTIQELRQHKKWTQEELVEKCNLNVRTLQRIEAGEVTPRDFTIRSILSALDYNIESIEKNLESRSTLRWLQLGWIFGIIYFITGFAEVWVDFERFDFYDSYFPLIYTAVKMIVLITFVGFFFGFARMANWFGSDLLAITSYIMIAVMSIIVIFDIISLFAGFSEEEFGGIKLIEAVTIGAIEVLFGIALYRFHTHLGTSAKVAGILEIITGACFVTIILIPVGLFILIPATILDIVVLYKAKERIQG